MSADEIAHLLQGKPRGSGRWYARCPIHEEKSPSLSIKAGDKVTLLYCFGCGAKAPAIMAAIGLKASDCFYDSGRKMDPKLRAAFKLRKRQAEELAKLERKQAMALVSILAYPNERGHWTLAEWYWWQAIKRHMLECDPERKARYQLARELRRTTFNQKWAALEASAEWPEMMTAVQR